MGKGGGARGEGQGGRSEGGGARWIGKGGGARGNSLMVCIRSPNRRMLPCVTCSRIPCSSRPPPQEAGCCVLLQSPRLHLLHPLHPGRGGWAAAVWGGSAHHQVQGGGEGGREEWRRKERKRERDGDIDISGAHQRPVFIYPPHTHSTNLIHMPFFPCGCEDLICWMSPPSAQVTSRQCPQPRLLPRRIPAPLHIARRRGSHWHA